MCADAKKKPDIPKKEWNVLPPIKAAAEPVGASKASLNEHPVLLKKEVTDLITWLFPVPAIPLKYINKGSFEIASQWLVTLW